MTERTSPVEGTAPPPEGGGELVFAQYKGRRVELHTNPDRVCVIPGDMIVTEAERGWDLGQVLLLRSPESIRSEPGGGRILRKATPEDLTRCSDVRAMDGEALRTVRERVAWFHLPMHLVDAEHQGDGNRLTLYFTAEHRVDFRELVRDLAGIFRTRIELRQIGSREAARRLGGIGACGRELCCGNILCDFERVTLRMARAQKLAYNPARLSGVCGRLLCCLTYELSCPNSAIETDGPVQCQPQDGCGGCS